MDEAWIDRAVEDKLSEVIDKYRSQGRDVHSVAGLRARVRADVEALRGTSQWVVLREHYNPMPKNRVAWCCVCEKPVNSGSTTAWLEDKVGNIFCSDECRLNTDKHPISFREWKARVKAKGSVTTQRKDIVGGEVVLGDDFTISFEDIKDIGDPVDDALVSYDTSVDWTNDDP